MGNIRNLIQGPLNREEEHLTVRHCFDSNGDWNLNHISFELLEQITNAIKATPLSYNQNAEDSLTQAFSKDGFFSHKSANLLARGLNPLNSDTMSLAWIMKTETIPRIQFFSWLCIRNSVPTGEVLGSKGLSLNPLCSLCLKSNKSINHLLQGCEVAQTFWQNLKFPHRLIESSNQSNRAWIETNCKSRVVSSFLGIPWKILFPLGIQHLWLHRNNFIFKTGVIDRSVHSKCIKSSTEFFITRIKCKAIRHKNSIQVSWTRPQEGWVKLNTDGSTQGNTGKAGCGGLI